MDWQLPEAGTMRLELTDDELATVRKVIRRYEKQARWSRFNRCGGIVASVILIGGGVWCLHMAEWWLSHPFGSPPDGSIREMTTAPATQVDIDLVRSEAVLSSVTASVCYAVGLYLGLLGTWFLCSTVTNWNRHKVNAVLAKIVRFLTEPPAEAS
jgi:hypothetical protein